VTDGVR